MQDPEVSVEQDRPEIRFVQPKPRLAFRGAQPNVNVQSGDAQMNVERPENPSLNVQVQQSDPAINFRLESDPNVNVERGEAEVNVSRVNNPQVDVQQGDPQVNFRFADGSSNAGNQNQQRQNANRSQGNSGDGQNSQSSQSEQRDQNTSNGQDGQNTQSAQNTSDRNRSQRDQQVRQASSSDSSEPRMSSAEQAQYAVLLKRHPLNKTRIIDIIGQTVYGQSGGSVGEVDEIAMRGDKVFVVVGVGRFLGLGEPDMAIPLTDFRKRSNGGLVLPQRSEAELERMPVYTDRKFRLLRKRYTVGDAYERNRS
ncbi:MAG: PRC-barrel domain-containing protein [Pseudomonadota bacterium]